MALNRNIQGGFLKMTSSSEYVRHYNLEKKLIKNKLRKIVAHTNYLGAFQQRFSFEIPEIYHCKLEHGM